jgi:tetratricopeptide (TPR) repeat protein
VDEVIEVMQLQTICRLLSRKMRRLLPAQWSLMAFIVLCGALGWAPVAAGADPLDKGADMFEKGDVVQAAHYFEKALRQDPDDPALNFYLGRCLLVLHQPQQALHGLEKAAALAPRQADYHFWLGVGYWANLDFDKEIDSYLKALQCDPRHVQARVYLGHAYLDRKQWQAALKQYDAALAVHPDLGEALYNRGLALQRMGRREDEKTAWKRYLDRYRGGIWAYRAAAHLNRLGDFSYRTYLLGRRRVVLPAVTFKSGGDGLGAGSAAVVERAGNILLQDRGLTLHIIVYAAHHADLAEARARRLKKNILARYPGIAADRVRTSWFDIAERVVAGDRTYELAQSVQLLAAGAMPQP